MDIEKLSSEQAEKLSKFIRVDQESLSQYQWDNRFQQQILSMLLNDRVFMVQSLDLIKPSYFPSPHHELICRILFEHFNAHKQLPTKHFLVNEIREKRKDDRELYRYLGEMDACLNLYVPGLESREAYLDKITEFAKDQAMRHALGIALDCVRERKENRWGKIREVMDKALSVDRNFDMGLDYFQTMTDRYERMKNEAKSKEVFPIGLPEIDNAISGGLSRGEVGAFMGLPGTGKSVLLVKAAVRNLLRNKKVLYVSLEMDQDKIARRFDAQLAVMSIQKLAENQDAVIQNITDLVREDQDKRRLIIKQFPAGSANVDTIRAYMSQLQLHGFKPDLLIMDYVGEMKDFEGVKTYESRQRLVRDLRGFGVEEQHCTLTALQPNRRGREQQEGDGIDDDALGDSFGQARPLDALWSINMTTNEKKAGVGRLFVVKHRDGQSRYTVYFKQNKETLDIQEITSGAYYEITSTLSEKKGEKGEHIKPFKPNGN